MAKHKDLEATMTSSSVFREEGNQNCLRIVFGPDERLLGLDLLLQDRPVEIGRSDGNTTGLVDDGRLEANDPRLSRRHAALRNTGVAQTATLEDLGSKNGTWLNGRRVDSAVLRLHDVLRVGDTLMVVCPVVWPAASREKQAGAFLGASAAMVETRRVARRIATEDMTVLIAGESGTGKELVAAAIHEQSHRTGRFVPLNSSAIPEGLFESELFGVKRGAFSGADKDRNGYIAEADGGTLFLDEIGDMPSAVQGKLLRALEDRAITRVGSTKSTHVDVRFVAATNIDLDARVAHGAFRADLLHRLRQFEIRIPALRERREDVPLLWNSFAVGGPDGASAAAVMEALLVYDWPGNVRELKNVALRYNLRAKDVDSLAVRSLPDTIVQYYKRAREGVQAEGGEIEERSARGEAPAPTEASDVHLPFGERPTREALLHALQLHDGNLAAVARHFGRKRPQAYRWLEHHGISLADIRPEPDVD